MAAIEQSIHALIIGAGPAGLATARQLARQGFGVMVIDTADRVGSSWSRHYDRLRLHTARLLSSLPGSPIPASNGQWVAREDFLRYLGDYATKNKLDVRLGVTATTVVQDGPGWAVATTEGTIRARIVVVATGYNHTPFTPDWSGVDSFDGRIIHSSEYRNPDQLDGGTVLVVGTGNSGAEIAADLAEAGRTVLLAARTTPNIVPRAVAGVPNQFLVLSISPLPRAARDVISGVVQRLVIGDLGRFGIGRAPRGIVTQLERDDVVPTIDVGLIAALRAGTVSVVASIDRFVDGAVRLSDGRTIAPDTIVAATGYRRGLESLVGGLNVLLENGRPLVNAADQVDAAPGLYFIGYSNPITGNIRQLAIDAGRIARHAKRRG